MAKKMELVNEMCGGDGEGALGRGRSEALRGPARLQVPVDHPRPHNDGRGPSLLPSTSSRPPRAADTLQRILPAPPASPRRPSDRRVRQGRHLDRGHRCGGPFLDHQVPGRHLQGHHQGEHKDGGRRPHRGAREDGRRLAAQRQEGGRLQTDREPIQHVCQVRLHDGRGEPDRRGPERIAPRRRREDWLRRQRLLPAEGGV